VSNQDLVTQLVAIERRAAEIANPRQDVQDFTHAEWMGWCDCANSVDIGLEKVGSHEDPGYQAGFLAWQMHEHEALSMPAWQAYDPQIDKRLADINAGPIEGATP
jgi:hypothetical protein